MNTCEVLESSDNQAHADKLPIEMRDHGYPPRFRNGWIREPED